MQPSTESAAGTASPLPGGAPSAAGDKGDSDKEQKLKLQLAAQKEMENRDEEALFRQSIESNLIRLSRCFPEEHSLQFAICNPEVTLITE